jgi:C_GCAxxG_C_C family probable redox protein
MESRIEKAIEKHRQGYNCAQAVACTYCDLVGVDESTMFKMIEGFGAGMGGMESTCGAVSGAIALAGMKNSKGCEDKSTKGKTYKLSKEIAKEFTEINQSTVCKVLKGVETKKMLRTCDGCIEDAARIAEKVLFQEEE